MQIREACLRDTEEIRTLYLKAFEESEARMVSDLAVSLLNEASSVDILSFVAVDNSSIIGHTAFSPVFLNATNRHFGYILAPLAVLPAYQKVGVGSSIVRHGIASISKLGSFIVFVYGDPQYYSRFGFKRGLAQRFSPPYRLQLPEGWQAMTLNSVDLPDLGDFHCVNSLNNSNLW